MATDTLKPGAGNNLLLSNDDASAKIEVKEDGTNEVTGNTGIGTGSPSSYAGYSGPILEIQGAQPVVTLHETGTGSPMWEVAGYSQSFRISDDGVDRFKIDVDGEITKPSQPAFHAYVSTSQTSPAGGDTVDFDTEMFDIGSNFDEGLHTFNAPVTGKYLFNVRLRLATVDNNSNYLVFYLATTGQTYNYLFGLGGADGGDFPYWAIAFSCIANMAATDTAKVTYSFSGGTTVGAINSGAEYAEFSGYLLG